MAFERNFPILFFPIGLFKNQISSSGFSGDEQPGRKDFPVIWPLLAVGRLLTNSLKQDTGHFLPSVSYASDGKIFGAHFVRRDGFCFPFRCSIPGTLRHSLHLFLKRCRQISFALPRVFRGTQRQFSEKICSEDDLRSRIFGTFVVKFLACLPVLGFSNISKMV